MKQTLLLTLGLICIYLAISSCRDKVEECVCPGTQICLDGLYGNCYEYESVHDIGGTRVIVPNSYIGFVTNNFCVDTLIFGNDTTRDDLNRFIIIVAVPFGAQNVAGSYPFKVSDKEYYLSTAAPLCYLNGEARYANVHVIIEPDSVVMKLRFWTLFTEPGDFIDSCDVILYKKRP